jgi:hypothetical protein
MPLPFLKCRTAVRPSQVEPPGDLFRDSGSHPEASNESALPRSFHGTPSVVLADICDRFGVGDSVQYGETGKRGTSSSMSASTGNFYALGLGQRPCLAQRFLGSRTVRGQPEIRPLQPAGLPLDRRRVVPEQIHREGRQRPDRERPAEPAATDKPPRRQLQHAIRIRFPESDHGLTLVSLRTRAGSATAARAVASSRGRWCEQFASSGMGPASERRGPCSLIAELPPSDRSR